EMPMGAKISEALCVCYGGVDSYDFHGLETIQCMVERRRGGETGVKWIQAYRGEKFWEALREGVWPRALMDAALCRSHTLVPAHPAHHRPHRGRGREPLPRPDPLRNASPGDLLPADQRFDLLEDLTVINRRHFLQTTAVTAAAAYAQTPPKRIAIVATIYRYL